MKASLSEVNQFTRNCFRMVFIVSKRNCFEIKISQWHDWETPSIMISWSQKIGSTRWEIS